jgi:hypothetical protein
LLLDTEFQQQEGLLQNKEVMAGWKTVVNKWIKTPEAKHAVRMQLNEFRNQEGRFSKGKDNDAMYAGIYSTPAWLWWLTYGTEAPELQSIAVRVLAQVASSGASERNWSAFDFIQTKRRNRLTPSLVFDLVYIYSNMKVLRQRERHPRKRSHGDTVIAWEWYPSEDEVEDGHDNAVADAFIEEEEERERVKEREQRRGRSEGGLGRCSSGAGPSGAGRARPWALG